MPKYVKPPIDTFDELWKSDMKVLTRDVYDYDYYVWYFGHVDNIESRLEVAQVDEKDDVLLQIYKRLQAVPDEYVCIYMYGNIGYYIDEFSKSHYRKFYKSKESLPAMSTPAFGI